jgi:hypothetical protein
MGGSFLKQIFFPNHMTVSTFCVSFTLLSTRVASRKRMHLWRAMSCFFSASHPPFFAKGMKTMSETSIDLLALVEQDGFKCSEPPRAGEGNITALAPGVAETIVSESSHATAPMAGTPVASASTRATPLTI